MPTVGACSLLLYSDGPLFLLYFPLRFCLDFYNENVLCQKLTHTHVFESALHRHNLLSVDAGSVLLYSDGSVHCSSRTFHLGSLLILIMKMHFVKKMTRIFTSLNLSCVVTICHLSELAVCCCIQKVQVNCSSCTFDYVVCFVTVS